jgi:adenylate cyclase
VPKLFVIARNSVFTYKGKSVKIKQVAEELGIRYVLEGSIRKDGVKIRITAQLIDALLVRIPEQSYHPFRFIVTTDSAAL